MSTEEDSNLIKHAQRELELAGLTGPDSDYEGMLGEAALEIVRVFSRQGHSGASAAMVTGIVQRLMRYEPLTPLTYGPEEWYLHEGLGPDGQDVWQNIRKSSVFSYDGGRTHYDLDEKN